MSAISGYILRQLAIVAVVVTATLTCAIWLTQSLRFVELIVNRGLTIESYLYLTLLLLPSFLSIMLPVSLFTAVLFTYNKLTADSEIVVLRAIGLGPLQLARPALFLAVAVVAIGYSLSLYFLPLSYRNFKDMESDLRNDYTAVLLREGVFNTVSDNVTVYIRSREPNGEIRGILVHDKRIKDKPTTIMAERGMLAMTDEGPRVIMINGNRQQVEHDTGKLSLLYFDRYSVDLGKITQAAQTRWREPRERFLHELLHPTDTPRGSLAAQRMKIEAHNRLTSPLYSLAMVLVALAALLSGDFNRRGQSRRLVIAVAIGIGLQIAAIGISTIATKASYLIPFLYANVIGAIAVAAYWLLRQPRRVRRAEAWVPPGTATGSV